MGSIIDKIKISTGRDSSNKFDLSCFHATTSGFFTPRVTYFHEFVPDEKWNMDARCSVRCLPMIKPTICDIKVHNRFFFVPYYSIMDKWNEFLAESPIGSGSTSLGIPTLPYIHEYDLVHLFITNTKYTTNVGDSAPIFDVKYSGHKYSFTPFGRTIYSILNGLGIVLDFNVTSASSSWGNTINMLSILAYLKVYLDWYNNSAFDSKVYLDYYFRTNNTHFSEDDLDKIFTAIGNIYLEKDYFTSATLYPIGSNSASLGNYHSIPDFTANDAFTVNSVPNSSQHGTPIIARTTNDQLGVASKYSIDAVNALTDYVKRHQLAGLQPFNRILAEYGVTLDDEVLRRSTFIGDVVEDVDVHSVVSQSYADDTTLGERSGLADGGNSKNLSYSNKNFGCIICITTVVPRLSYTDGIRKANLRMNRFDFFTPSVEHLGVEPVAACELYNRFNGNTTHHANPGTIFGYMPRYSSYKTALDSMSGDFIFDTKNLTILPWILKREYPNIGTDLRDVSTISEEFTKANPDKVSDIFVDESQDNFIIFNMYHVTARLPMHQLFDDYQWSNDGDNPQKVTLPNQGVQLT